MPTTSYKVRPGQFDFEQYRATPGGAILLTPELETRLKAANDGIEAETAAKIRSQRRMENIFKAVSLGIVGGAGVAGAMGAGGAASSAAAPSWSMPGVSAPSFGAPAASTASSALGATAPKVAATSGIMSRLGNIFSSAGFETAANTGLALLGMRQQNKAGDQARADALANQAKMIELEQQRLAQELQNATLDREDARALNAAIQELEKKKFALQQESMQFERGIIEKNQGVKDRYNANISEPAAARMRSILGLG